MEPQLRRILLIASSLSNLEDASCECFPLVGVGSSTYDLTDGCTDSEMIRSCCQALSNMVTDNEELAARYFPGCLELEETDHLIS